MWNLDNTEGFTQAELDDINAVMEFAMQHTELEPYQIETRVLVIWQEGMTRDELLTAVSARLNIT